MKLFTRLASATIFILLIGSSAFSQLAVTPSTDANALAQSLVGSGVIVTNAVLTTVGDAAGTFTYAGSNLGIPAGILLTSGFVQNAVGPNYSSGITGANNAPGDADLTAISTSQTYDATILEFDVTVTADTLTFNYVFGSDEYNEYVNSSFNDVFAFFISGPGITGQQNIALIPNTTVAVTINNVNCGSYGSYYVCNDPWTGYTGGCTYQCPTTGNELEYDGYTVQLQAIAIVEACETYHLRLAVADAGDGILDSGVFIEAGSLNAVGNAVIAVTGYVDPNTNSFAIVEDCNEGTFDFTIPSPIGDTVVIHYSIGGSAIEGTDYLPVPDSILILPGDTSESLIISPIVDGQTEFGDFVIVYLYLSCSTEPYDSAIIYILDELVADAGNDTSICMGDSVQLNALLAPVYAWSPPGGLSCTNCQSPYAFPTDTTTYTLFIQVGPCTALDQVTVNVDQYIPVEAGSNESICEGESVQLGASNANTYLWSPSTGLDNSNVSNPVASPSQTTTYVVTGSNACTDTYDSLIVVVNPTPVATASNDTSVCPQQPVQLNAGGGVSYQWQPTTYLNYPDIQNPVATVSAATTYTVIVTNQFGCMDSTDVTISTIGGTGFIVSGDTSIYLGNSVTLNATGGVNYVWQPPTGLSDPNSESPIATPTQTTTYYVYITNDQGCIIVDSVTVVVLTDALVLVPNAFSPNSDGFNDIMHVLVRGVFDLNYFKIYNRWGQEIFTTNDPAIGWDGTYPYPGGEPQEIGSYVYLVKGIGYSGELIARQGNITLVR